MCSIICYNCPNCKSIGHCLFSQVFVSSLVFVAVCFLCNLISDFAVIETNESFLSGECIIPICQFVNLSVRVCS